jgi:2Fe-2S ferredoxin
MAKITFVEFNGAARTLDVPEGWTVMQGAVSNGIEGIEAECGGSGLCGTCHVYIDEATSAKLPPRTAGEEDTLDGVAAEVRPTSRLSCQIEVTADVDGMTVTLPETQS